MHRVCGRCHGPRSLCPPADGAQCQRTASTESQGRAHAIRGRPRSRMLGCRLPLARVRIRLSPRADIVARGASCFIAPAAYPVVPGPRGFCFQGFQGFPAEVHRICHGCLARALTWMGQPWKMRADAVAADVCAWVCLSPLLPSRLAVRAAQSRWDLQLVRLRNAPRVTEAAAEASALGRSGRSTSPRAQGASVGRAEHFRCFCSPPSLSRKACASDVFLMSWWPVIPRRLSMRLLRVSCAFVARILQGVQGLRRPRLRLSVSS